MSTEAQQNLHGRIGRGVAWSAIDVALTRTGNFALGLVVARLLVPRDFGIYAIAVAVHSIVLTMNDLGLSAALARGDKESAKKEAPTIATLSLISSTALGAAMVVLAPEFARWLGDVHATSTMRVMAISLPLAGLSAVPFGMLRRDFRTDIQFLADVSNLIATVVVVLILALSGAGPLALAWSFVAGQVMTTIILIFSPNAWCWPGWDRRESLPLLRFSLPLMGANMLNYAIQNVDYIVVGAVAGAVPLGYYMLAFNISGWPQNLISSVVHSVSVSAFSRLREIGNDMTRTFARALSGVSKMTLPVCMMIGALAHPLVITAYGHKWGIASQALVALSFMGMARVLVSLLTDYLVSLGHTTGIFVVQALWLPSLILALVLAVHHDGIAGAGIAQAGVSWFIIMPAFTFVLSRNGIPAWVVIRSIAPPFLWAAASAAVAWLVSNQISVAPLAVLAGGAAGTSMYVIPYLREIRGLIEDQLARRRAKGAAAAMLAAEPKLADVADVV
ncbi:MAG TPA: oligosaccharide flippase family protein [Solirubrobacteraceae bacterium]|jgi:PST family polysaccharide transporter|nr:oligosaccharide flippase family protein [Solirubrobacteraceae bacterium]